MKTSGIYRIIHKTSGAQYIGQSTNLRARRQAHFWELKKGRHKNPRLQRAFSKHGAEAFEFQTLLICRACDLTLYEQAVLDATVKSHGILAVFNVKVECVSSLYGTKRSAETKAKIGAAHKGKLVSEETKRKISAARMGHTISEETRAKKVAWAAANPDKLKRVITAEQRAMVSARHTGKTISAAHRQAVSAALKGNSHSKGRRLSQERKDEISAFFKGRPFSDEQRAAISASKKGKPRPRHAIEAMTSPKACAKAWATRKAKMALAKAEA